jgi:hypothetical protein
MPADRFSLRKEVVSIGSGTQYLSTASQQPATKAFAITESDDNDVEEVTRAVYVGGAGDIAVVMAEGGAPVVFGAVPAGTLLPIRISRLMSTDTTATNVVGLV